MSSQFVWFFTVMAAIMLFLHGLAAFSDEVTKIGGERLRQTLQRLTRSDWRGAVMGAFATAIVQSSSAVTSMAVGLAHSKVFTHRGAFAVMIGANVGTTLTAWLVALEIAGLGPVFVTLGGLWSFVGIRPYRAYGKAIFYFGIIFLALDLISEGLAPIGQSPYLAEWHEMLESPILALIFSAILTALVQSSSVVSGLSVLLVMQGIISPATAMWMVAGANVGTSSTAMLASSVMNSVARKLAFLNLLFKILGLLLFVTILQPVIAWVLASQISAVQQVALVHTIFNVVAASVSLAMMPFLWGYIKVWLNRPDRVAELE